MRKFPIRITVYFILCGAIVSVAVAWGLAFKQNTGQNSQTATAQRDEEHIELAIRTSLGTLEAILTREMGRAWSPSRAVGPPDTASMGDLPTA